MSCLIIQRISCGDHRTNESDSCKSSSALACFIFVSRVAQLDLEVALEMIVEKIWRGRKFDLDCNKSDLMNKVISYSNKRLC